ncbi:trimeric intracellular cation channel family protein [Dactylosporangium siamense]|uniref:Membrane protein n=1 Tax=Dactylosporangium siamense TaxID=685454 RepID=A0A919PSD7_9ACTN|nr:TRIC cation channel family protein [Dactylosporangium siamense]GIG49342.1 membrane protein [Dactylosporangium siamense]
MSELSLLLVVDLVGIAVFAASGATAGVAKRLDLFGVVFVGFMAALGGGILRDVFVNVQPFAFVDWRYAAVAVVTSAATFWLHPTVSRLHWTVLVLDAAGLGLFTVTGTLKALDAGIPPVGACIIGMITGIGGGLIRDLLTGEIPTVLRREIYAVAGLLGCASVAALDAVHTQRPVSIALAAVLVFVLRMVALRRNWSAPTAPTAPTGPQNPGE